MGSGMTLDIYKALGEWFKQQRERLGLNTRQAAELLGISKGKLGYIEAGQTSKLTVGEVNTICSAYGVDDGTATMMGLAMPATSIQYDLHELSQREPLLMARIGALYPELIGPKYEYVVMDLAQKALDALPAIREWFDTTECEDTELFLYKPAELKYASALRDFLRALAPKTQTSSKLERNHAAALAILDTAWMAEHTNAEDLVDAISTAAKILIPDTEIDNDE